MLTEDHVQMQKAVLWEEAKGKLRAMVNVEGHRRLCHPMTPERERIVSNRWLEITDKIEAFISEAEDNGWNE